MGYVIELAGGGTKLYLSKERRFVPKEHPLKTFRFKHAAATYMSKIPTIFDRTMKVIHYDELKKLNNK
jgi:hypothetical protein